MYTMINLASLNCDLLFSRFSPTISNWFCISTYLRSLTILWLKLHLRTNADIRTVLSEYAVLCINLFRQKLSYKSEYESEKAYATIPIGIIGSKR